LTARNGFWLIVTMPASPRIKICCIANVAEACLAIACGADALGLVSEMPSGPGVISEHDIADIARHVPPPIATFLLTCKTDAQQIIAQQRRCRTNTLQICDSVSADCLRELRRELCGVKLVQVIHVSGRESLAEAIAVSDKVDALLLDSGNQKLAIKELGGTGRTHDWTTSRQIVEAVPIPVFLAGGLNFGNVHEALHVVRPFGLDICSGVRTEGQLDETKLRNFFEAVATFSNV
jgi:phosphoribosylanthranilate isomerase